MFFFFRVNFIELKLFGLLSFGFSFGSWFGREMEWENWNGRIVFGDVVQSEKRVVCDVCCDKKME